MNTGSFVLEKVNLVVIATHRRVMLRAALAENKVMTGC